jgi:hypothetical protein
VWRYLRLFSHRRLPLQVRSGIYHICACSHTVACRSRPCARYTRHNQAPPMPDVEEEEEAAPEAPREPPAADDDDDDDLYAQPQARLARRLALDGAAEVPTDVRALLAQGLRSIYDDDDEYIELPEAMERAFRAAVDAKAVASDTEPKSYRDAMRRPDSLSCGTKPWCARWRPTSRTARGNSSSCRTGARPLAPSGSSRSSATPTAPSSATRPASSPKASVSVPTSISTRRLPRPPSGPLAAVENLELESIDISNAYLNGVYMQQPDGFAERNSTWVARLLKGLYGLKQGGREWFRRLEEVLVELGFARIRSDPSVLMCARQAVRECCWRIDVPRHCDAP